MSYWVYLESSDGASVSVPAHAEGGTFARGGTAVAELNVTYNFSAIYADYGFSLRDLDGKRAADAAPTLARLVDVCGTREAADYWSATPGNAGHALNILLGWARAHPDAVFRVT